MEQMQQNPQMMQNMMSAPYTQSMFQAMSQNPELASSVIAGNPLFAGNPEMQERMRSMMPQFMAQMQNPAVQGMMTNPEALAALNQIQTGLQRLQQVAPEIYQSMGMPALGPGMFVPPPAGATTASASSVGLFVVCVYICHYYYYWILCSHSADLHIFNWHYKFL